jgi:hypothetical protein
MTSIISAVCSFEGLCAKSGFFLYSDSMTIEMCLQACLSQQFTHASINMFEFKIIDCVKNYLFTYDWLYFKGVLIVIVGTH